MPTRTRTEQYKQQIVGALRDATNNGGGAGVAGGGGKPTATSVVDGTNKEHVSMMIADLRKGLDRKLESIRQDMLTCKQDQYHAHCAGMAKIPKSVKEMSIKDFNEKYNCNLLELLQTAKNKAQGQGGQAVQQKKAPPPVYCGKRDRFETPMATHRGGNRPMETPSTARTVRRGEMLFSKNGSPVDAVDEGSLVATVTKKRRPNAPAATAANFDINLGEGRYISLNDPSGVENLDENMKTNALSQLKVLQDQMASLMEQLTTNDKK